MSVLDRKLRRDIFLTKGLLATIILIITFGTACLVGMMSTYKSLREAQFSYYSSCRMADFWIDLKKVSQGEIDKIRNIKGVSEIISRITFPVIIDIEGKIKPVSGKIVSVPNRSLPSINTPLIKSGSLFTDERNDEVIVSHMFAKAGNIKSGDFITLILNGRKKKLYVIGTAICSEFMIMASPGSITPDPAGYGVFWVRQQYAEEAFGFHGACNNIVGLLTPEAKKNPLPVLNEISSKLDSYGVFSTIPLKNQYSNVIISGEMKGLQMQATFIPAIFLCVAAMVLNIVMFRMAEQQRTVIGTFKALGINDSTILSHFLKYGLFVGVSGGVLGCLFGNWISSQMISLYKLYFSFPNLNSKLYPGIMLIAICISAVFAVLGAFCGAKKIIKLSPAESMRPKPPEAIHKTFFENWSWLWSKLDFKWQMVFRYLFKNKTRTSIGISSAMLGGSIVLLALGFSDAISYMLFSQFDKTLRSDFTLSLRNELGEEALFGAKRLPGVYYAEPQLNVACDFISGNRKKKGAILGVVAGSKLTYPCNKDGLPVKIPETGLLITKRMADYLQLSPGDFLIFKPVKGYRTAQKVPVAGLIESSFGLPVYADYDYLNKLIGERKVISQIQLKANHTKKEKQKFLKKIKKLPELASLGIIAEQREQIKNDFVAKMQVMTIIMIAFAGVIFFGSILNASLISISERQREIATFMALGYHSYEIGAVFFLETLLVNMTGAMLGLPLGYLMLCGMASGFESDTYFLPAIIEPESWFLTIIITFLFIVCAHYIIQKSIKRLNWGEALKAKE